jgi:triacylglycerol lipase
MREPALLSLVFIATLTLSAMTHPDTRSAADGVGDQPAGRLDVPVVLVPGWFDTSRDFAAMRIRFIGAGLDGSSVRALTFEEPTGSNVGHAEEIHSLVQQLLTETGSERVDIVAHSMGGLATRWYLNTHDDAPVRRVVFLGTPHRGTVSAHLAWGESREEMLPDSPFLEGLNALPAVPQHVDAITVRTPIDTHVLPGESALLEGFHDHVVCCPSHAGLLDDEDVFVVVLDFLERLDPRSRLGSSE